MVGLFYCFAVASVKVCYLSLVVVFVLMLVLFCLIVVVAFYIGCGVV